MQGVQQPIPTRFDLCRQRKTVVLFRQPFIVFTPSLPMVIRPITGGVIASPLIMMHSFVVELRIGDCLRQACRIAEVVRDVPE